MQISAFRFLSLSDCLTESFLAVLLDWLDYRVALLPLMQLSMDWVDESTFFSYQWTGLMNLLFFHIPELNFISDKSVFVFQDSLH